MPRLNTAARVRPRAADRRVTKATADVTDSETSHPVDQADRADGRARPEHAALTALVAKAAGGDRQALERLLYEAQAVAWRFSRTVCGQSEDAEDAMQEALIQTYRAVSRIRRPEAFRPWLYRTVRNACLMSRRARVHAPRRLLSLDHHRAATADRPPLDPPAATRTPEQLVFDARLRRRLNRALARLPSGSRAVVFLREMEGLSTRETAHALGLSEDTVKARLHRARIVLQRELAEDTAATSSPPARQPVRRPKGRQRSALPAKAKS